MRPPNAAKMPTEIGGFGSAFQPLDFGRQGVRVGLGATDLERDCVGIVRQVDAGIVRRSDFDIFFEPSRRLITRVAAPWISGSGSGKK